MKVWLEYSSTGHGGGGSVFFTKEEAEKQARYDRRDFPGFKWEVIERTIETEAEAEFDEEFYERNNA